MFGFFNKSKSISTRLGVYEYEQFLARAKSQDKTISVVLREAVIYYLDNYGKTTIAATQPPLIEPKKTTLLAMDYDDLSPEPRPNRLFWGS